MILRKPYALLIKNFRLIHIVLTILTVFFFMKCNNILNFLNSYAANSGFIIEQYKINELIPWTFILGMIFFILVNIVISVLMKIKDKSVTFYIINIVFYFAMIILVSYTSTTLNTMQTRIVDIRIVKALQDIYFAINFASIISIFMYGMRATGFDIKKFNFNKDLNEIEITEADNEEFEVSVNVDTNKIVRKRRRSLRMLKYFYVENRFICNCVLAIVGVITLIAIIYSLLAGDPTYNQFNKFNAGNYNLEIGKTYVTELDKDDSVIIKDKAFVVMEIKVKKRVDSQTKLNIGRFALEINGHSYYHNYSYKDYFNDIGSSYTDEELTKEYQKFVLIYRINKDEVNKKMNLKYSDGTNNLIVKLKPINLAGTSVVEFNLSDKIKLENTILNNYEFSIDKFEIAKNILVNYKYCLTTDNCINAKEYIIPTLNTNFDKAILRIDYSFFLPDDYNSYATNINMLFNRFGYLKYVIDNKEFTSKLNLGTLKSLKVKQDNTTYLEIKEDVLKASKVVLGVKLRNKTYEVVLKGGVE